MRRLLTDFLRRDGYTVLTASDGREALELFDQHPETAVAVLDVMMPEVDGWTVCRHIRTRSSIPIIMLTARSEEHDQLFGFEIGATDYVTKPFSPRVLVARIRAHLSTRTAAPSPDDQAVRLDRSAHRLYIDGDEVELSPKEYELLDYLTENAGIALGREQLLAAVWNYSYTGDDRTLDTHVKRLRAKLGTHRERLKTVRGYGYRWETS